jgi:hypothetical protein
VQSQDENYLESETSIEYTESEVLTEENVHNDEQYVNEEIVTPPSLTTPDQTELQFEEDLKINSVEINEPVPTSEDKPTVSNNSPDTSISSLFTKSFSSFLSKLDILFKGAKSFLDHVLLQVVKILKSLIGKN